MYLETGSPMRGTMLSRLKAFLKDCGLTYDEGVDFSCALIEDDEIIAAGSLEVATLKCIAVSPLHQGEDLTSRLITELRREAFSRGHDHLMLFTKPGNQFMFREFGFYPVYRTSGCLLMENKRDGLQSYIASLDAPHGGTIGAIVGNFNPFTLGHRYLIETAAGQCDHLHVFVLSERKSAFTPEVRMELARAACADIKNISFHFTGPYLVSTATFPSYFIKDKAQVGGIHCGLDVGVFAERIAPALGVTRRFLGTEPICPVTRFYNEQMKALLPGHGIEVIEIPRREAQGEAVSASRVRALLQEKNFAAIRPLVPETTYDYLIKNHG
ncbi:MAG: [citrate (pro-3S)-lyase] ligase [Clostridia bacterium]|nr:[citrate (pro-3S)-lyase] ligase [Clostridia bacterium]